MICERCGGLREKGTRKYCKICSKDAKTERIRKYNQRYYEENKEGIKNAARIYYKNNLGKCRERNARWYTSNKEKCKESNREWCRNNPKKAKEISKRYREKNKEKKKDYYKKNREEFREKAKRRYKNNKKKYQEMNRRWRSTSRGRLSKRLSEQRREACKKKVIHNFVADEWNQKLKDTFGVCPVCNTYVGMLRLALDHIYPISKAYEDYLETGMKRKYTIDDIQPLCISCNSSKKDKVIGG